MNDLIWTDAFRRSFETLVTFQTSCYENMWFALKKCEHEINCFALHSFYFHLPVVAVASGFGSESLSSKFHGDIIGIRQKAHPEFQELRCSNEKFVLKASR